MTNNQLDWRLQIEKVIKAASVKIKDVKPSTWAEQNIVLGKPIPGPLRYQGRTPFNREIIDFLAPDHPGRELAVMGSAQFGKTMTILIPGLGWVIENDPAPIIMTVGHKDLIEDAMEKVDFMLDKTKLRRLIKPQAQRAKNQKSGDTNFRKEFPNGFLVVRDASNPKIWRQASYKYGFIDDFDAVRTKTKVAGNVKGLIDKRFNTFDKTKKVIYLSSPELAGKSNIETVYKLGDQRRYMIPCPCCGVYIELMFEITGRNGQPSGMTWDLDEDMKLIPESVRYRCQECGDTFTDENKMDLVDRGYWQPTARPFRPEFYSYYMNGLYSPPGMADWVSYVYKYLEANPPGGLRDESKWQTFLNIDLGLPYEGVTDKLTKGSELQMNTRQYEIGTVPEKQSVADGNGKIVMLTCAVDLNGTEDDARLDWEIVAHAENQSTYSVAHGSIGTFLPANAGGRTKEYSNADRVRWTYQRGQANCVWPELDKILAETYLGDSGAKLKIFLTAIDSGKYTSHVYDYKDRSNFRIVLVKGNKEERYVRKSDDAPIFRPGKERPDLYLLEVGRIKDRLAEYMALKKSDIQPANYMNFPQPTGGKYGWENFFSHYESEHRVTVESLDGSVMMRWVKKKQNAQNHMWDCRVYNLASREIAVYLLKKELKISNFGWADLVRLLKGGNSSN